MRKWFRGLSEGFGADFWIAIAGPPGTVYRFFATDIWKRADRAAEGQ
jgi:hypothetical protein